MTVDLAFGKRCQPRILAFGLNEVQLQEIDNFKVAQHALIDGHFMAELIRPGDERAATVDLI